MVDMRTATAPSRPVETAAYAAAHGLQPVGRRPALGVYIRRVWDSRFFLRKLSYLRYRAQNDEDFLGAGWNLLRPLLSAAVYSLIFGLILHIGAKFGGPKHRIVFITCGVFVFNYTSSSIQASARSVVSNLNLVRALPFPRAVLPVSAALVDTLSTMPSYLALCFIGLIVHAPSWAWLAMAPMMAIQLIFNIGIGFFVARFTVHMRDFAQFLPFITRVWFYLSGVLYTLDGTATIRKHPTLRHVLELNPPHIFISIARNAVMVGKWEPLHEWVTAMEWSVGLCVLGFLYFWHAEEVYGRD